MSSENEDQAVSQAELAPKETPDISCAVCHSVIADGDSRVSCDCEKYLCARCFTTSIRYMFGNPALSYPLKCLDGIHTYDENTLLPFINQQAQYEKYVACILPLHWAKDCLQDHESIASCEYSWLLILCLHFCLIDPGPFCPYLEIHKTDACSMHIFSCRNPICAKKSCLICHHLIEDEEDLALHRTRCFELKIYKQRIEEAIEAGSKQHCPHCQLAGVKNDACTHMICQRCRNSWCYFCGMKEKECSVPDDVEPSLSAHNLEWESNEGRCPMVLAGIQEIDPRWPDDDTDCLEYFHRHRTLAKLYGVWNDIGEEKFNEVNRMFGTIDASGYSIEEIQDFPNRILIDYSSKEQS